MLVVNPTAEKSNIEHFRCHLFFCDNKSANKFTKCMGVNEKLMPLALEHNNDIKKGMYQD